MNQTVSRQQVKPAVAPRGGPAGSGVVVTMAGLPPLLSVRIGFGSLSQYEVFARAESDEEGKLTASVRVPAWAERDRLHYFVVSAGNRMPRVVSEAFHVTDADGTARVLGTISSEGISCLGLEGPEKTPYTLHGNIARWSPGLRVLVIGSVADAAACGGDGLPISVREIQPA